MRWIGERVRELRVAQGLSRDAVGSNRSYTLKLEDGKLTPRLLSLERIADRLGVGLWRFFVSDDLHKSLLMLEDPFVMAVNLYLHGLSPIDRARIIKVLAAAPKVTK